MKHSNTQLPCVKIMLISMVLVFVLYSGGCVSIPLRTQIDTPKVIDDFSFPESIIVDPASGRLFVSNVGDKLEPSTKDGDGFITELSSDGMVIVKKYLPKTGVLHAPKGMAIIGRTLFVTDIDRVVGFDLLTREQTFELDFSLEQTVFLNDLTVFDDRTLFVSATDIGKIYKISLDKSPSFTIIAEDIPGVNGLYFDSKNKRLFVVSFGENYNFNGALGVITFQDNNPEYRSLTGQLGALDGVALLPDSRVIFSDWVALDKTGLIRIYNLRNKRLSVINLSEKVRGPADFFYDEKSGNLYLPRMLDGKVLVEKINVSDEE